MVWECRKPGTGPRTTEDGAWLRYLLIQKKSNYSKINKPYYKKLNEINKHFNEKTKMRCLRCHQKI